VRVVLGKHLGVNGRDLRVSRTDTGKPIIADGIHFNVSHSGDLILLALSEQRDVGVDVERRREVTRVDALVSRWLTEDEQLALRALMANGAELSDAFLRIWSIKEARLKALGVGISGALRASLHGVEAVVLDRFLDQLSDSPDAERYVGALAFA